jgi:hypothetical protein
VKSFGLVLGQELGVIIRIWPKSDTLLWDNARVELNDHIPARLARLIPCGYATPNVTGKDWEGFLIEAVGLGLLT